METKDSNANDVEISNKNAMNNIDHEGTNE